VGVDIVVLGLGTVDRFHVERVTEHEGDPLTGTEIGEPIPAEDALAAHDEIRTVGLERAKQGLGLTAQPFVQTHFALGIQDAQVERASMKVDATVVSMLALELN